MKRVLLDQILEERARRRAFVVATRVPEGDQVLLLAPDDVATPLHEGREAANLAMELAARVVLERDAADTVELSGGQWLLVPHNPPLRLLVVGAVHISQALVPMARLVDLEVVVIDPRTAWATPERFPGVTLEHAWPEAAFGRLGLDRRTAVVTLTHDKKLDDPALALALASPAFYIGALGSRKTQEARRERLRGRFTDDDLARIHGPIGLAIGAKSPAEIAVSILAEVIATHRARP